ncbi:hypothetical protein KCG43_12685 [Photobacterium sp. WH24]|uniref:response regulator receiver domain n=1 Tax=Photobacterium sp. WH24 TaxID=2827237 RepID=UPI001C43992C|nr:response regulator receiver domain [Photobacterium sp. WH24]MBV7262853.1 hypothetical protein [Photobacterium sp. WH24]
MEKSYEEQIIKTFRDDAIKSVLLVDDDFVPYESLVHEFLTLTSEIESLSISTEGNADEAITLEEGQSVVDNKLEIFRIITTTKNKIKNSETAKEFTEFFHRDKRICDVEERTDNLDYDKVRKSDLIILDYHLEPGAPVPAASSLDLISKLSDSRHLNMVVIFTNEPLKQVWLEVATVLRGTHNSDPEIFFNDKALNNEWMVNSNEWESYWANIVSRSHEVAFLCKGDNIPKLWGEMKEECENDHCSAPRIEHVKYLMEKALNNHNKIDQPITSLEVHGNDGLWIQAGDVFVVLCSKVKNPETQEISKPQDVWDQIENALIDWYPSFYRVVTSQLQNQIEDTNLSMKKALAKGEVDQIAALWGIERLPKDKHIEASKALMANLLEDIFSQLQNNKEVVDFITNVAANAIYEKEKYISTVDDADEAHLSIAHAYNEQLSTTHNFQSYITTGTIVKDENNVWYLCVTPSCNTVPTQPVQEFKPHRQLTFAKLKPEGDLSEVLKEAHKSMHVFVKSPDGKQLVFSVVKQASGMPDLVKIIVKNHDNGEWEDGEKKVVLTKNVTKKQVSELQFVERTFTPIAQLRPAYAARFQNIQSHYEGRIGVDFASFNLDEMKSQANASLTIPAETAMSAPVTSEQEVISSSE